ncbi:hypothetical protein P8C59_005963 [Phyllachora maydis]|uniref:Uncharacterized protein n=1 Tax=Phyllachora maydis TaxID=1825666 RepID=A0AAD9MC18_9PEZI|nr:hypothetical protein P8C59_005963 [Phyllachora maydis]
MTWPTAAAPLRTPTFLGSLAQFCLRRRCPPDGVTTCLLKSYGHRPSSDPAYAIAEKEGIVKRVTML